MVLRNVNTGAFEVYDIANNQLTGAASLGQVGLDWQLGGFAADPPRRLYGQLRLDRTTRASDGGVWRRRGSRELEYRTSFCRHVTASASDGPAAARMRLRSAQE